MVSIRSSSAKPRVQATADFAAQVHLLMARQAQPTAPPRNRESVIGATTRKQKGDGMTIVLEPTRDELISAWHRCNPMLSREEAADSFDEWWKAGCLDIKWNPRTGEWRVLLSQERTRQ